MVHYASFATDACLKQFVDKQKRWKVFETGGEGGGGRGSTDDGMCVSTHMLGRSGGMLPSKKF